LFDTCPTAIGNFIIIIITTAIIIVFVVVGRIDNNIKHGIERF
jgi:hypothetical protein